MYTESMKKDEGTLKKDRVEILLEHIEDKIDRLAEVNDGMNERLIRVEDKLEEVAHNTSDYPVFKEVVKDHSVRIQELEKQIA
jgi:Mg2+ and Co2+ transporter CorA